MRRGWRTALADVNEDAGGPWRPTPGARRVHLLPLRRHRRRLGQGRGRGAVDTYGRLDAAFNAAGIDGEHGKRTADCTMENWNRVIAVDLTGTFSCMRHEIPAIIEPAAARS